MHRGEGYQLCLSTSSCARGWGYPGVPSAGHAPSGGGRWGHCLRDLLGVDWESKLSACRDKGCYDGVIYRNVNRNDHCWMLPYMLAPVRLPSLHLYYACIVYLGQGGIPGKLQAKARQDLFFPSRVFLLCRNSLQRLWGVIVWHLWIPLRFFLLQTAHLLVRMHPHIFLVHSLCVADVGARAGRLSVCVRKSHLISVSCLCWVSLLVVFLRLLLHPPVLSHDLQPRPQG